MTILNLKPLVKGGKINIMNAIEAVELCNLSYVRLIM